jgi:hypothetical protein
MSPAQVTLSFYIHILYHLRAHARTRLFIYFSLQNGETALSIIAGGKKDNTGIVRLLLRGKKKEFDVRTRARACIDPMIYTIMFVQSAYMHHVLN